MHNPWQRPEYTEKIIYLIVNQEFYFSFLTLNYWFLSLSIWILNLSELKKKIKILSKGNFIPFLWSLKKRHFFVFRLKPWTLPSPEWIPQNLNYTEARVLTDLWSPFSSTSPILQDFCWFSFVLLGCKKFWQERKSRRHSKTVEKMKVSFNQRRPHCWASSRGGGSLSQSLENVKQWHKLEHEQNINMPAYINVASFLPLHWLA